MSGAPAILAMTGRAVREKELFATGPVFRTDKRIYHPRIETATIGNHRSPDEAAARPASLEDVSRPRSLNDFRPGQIGHAAACLFHIETNAPVEFFSDLFLRN